MLTMKCIYDKEEEKGKRKEKELKEEVTKCI